MGGCDSMLLQFSVENYKSIKEPTILSFEASADKSFKTHVCTKKNNRILKTISIFGANASGKSNLFGALTTAILMIRYSNHRQVGEPLNRIVPFKFSPKTIHEPSSFEFVFFVDDIKYVYGFSATRERIVEEHLFKYKTSHASTVFVRTFDEQKQMDQYHFTNPEIKKELLPLTQRNTNNKLFLATAASWNSKEAKTPFLWFTDIDTYSSTDYTQLLVKDDLLFSQDEDNTLHDFVCNILQEADINIQDYNYDSKKLEPFANDLKMPQELRDLLNQDNGLGKAYKIEMIHRIKQTDGAYREYKLNAQEESQGTQNLFFLSPILKEAFNQGKILCIDEFDKSLHPMLVQYLVSLFNNPQVNRKNAQLLISTHTMDLLSSKTSRRDEIYFMQKNQETGESELYSLDEFSTRKGADIRKGYLLGRYGAVPDIGDGDLLW